MPRDPAAGLTTLTRLGFAARGLLYIVIGLLLLRSGRTEDPAGALGYIAQGGGRVLLVLIVAGFVAYGLWRLTDAALNIERHEPGKKGAGERLGALASGLVHLFLAWQGVRLLRGAAAASGSGAQDGAASALQLPGGTMLLLLGGLILIGVGIGQIVIAAKASFCRYLEAGVANRAWVKAAGRAGYAARGIVFLISGAFLFGAGLKNRSSEAGGMDEVLSWLDSPWDVVIAVGLLGFGLFSLVEARFRVIHDVPVGDVARHARAKLPI